MGAVLHWCGQQADWIALRSDPGQRLLWLAAVVALAAVAYFSTLRLAGMDIRAIVRR
jgi:putative peptidoglycan lipid II flippase